jgi:hypothetical protein
MSTFYDPLQITSHRIIDSPINTHTHTHTHKQSTAVEKVESQVLHLRSQVVVELENRAARNHQRLTQLQAELQLVRKVYIYIRKERFFLIYYMKTTFMFTHTHTHTHKYRRGRSMKGRARRFWRVSWGRYMRWRIIRRR